MGNIYGWKNERNSTLCMASDQYKFETYCLQMMIDKNLTTIIKNDNGISYEHKIELIWITQSAVSDDSNSRMSLCNNYSLQQDPNSGEQQMLLFN